MTANICHAPGFRFQRFVVSLKLLGISASALFLASCGPKAPLEPASVATQSKLIDLGGRKIHVVLQGKGSPTVVIESGMGEPGAEGGLWNTVMDEIAKTHRVMAYDRAGLGTSDPAPKLPRTSRDIADDLHSLLTRAGVREPILLVGHSFGGLHSRAFADRHPERVAGMVLVDATHPDQDERWLAALPPASPREPESLRNARQFLSTRSRSSSNPEQIDPVASTAQVRSAKGLSNKPLVILTHSPGFKMDPSLPDGISKNLEKVSQDMQADFRKLSSRSTLKQSQSGGHNLHVDDPALVIQGIQEALRSVSASLK